MANPQHHISWVVAPPGFTPKIKLLRQISSWLSGQSRISCTDAFPAITVAGGAGWQSARRVAFMIKLQSGCRGSRHRIKGQAGIITRNRLPFVGRKLFGYPAHLRMVAAAIRIGFKLPFQIPGVQPCQTGGTGPISMPVETMTSEAGVACAGSCAAHRNYVTVICEAVERRCFRLKTTREHGQSKKWQEETHTSTTDQSAGLFRLMPTAFLPLLLAGCQQPLDDRHFMPMASAERGSKIIERAGCGSCHTIPGMGWPQGKVGPNLEGLAERALIAGRLPNQPDILAAYIRNAPALVPGSGMPAMPVNESESRDIAAYLYQAKER